MLKIIAQTAVITALLGVAATTASASPATRLLDRDFAVRSSIVQPVYYYWNHHRYRHRTWDRRHRRWRYY